MTRRSNTKANTVNTKRKRRRPYACFVKVKLLSDGKVMLHDDDGEEYLVEIRRENMRPLISRRLRRLELHPEKPRTSVAVRQLPMSFGPSPLHLVRSDLDDDPAA
jgi:hypothetical protein